VLLNEGDGTFAGSLSYAVHGVPAAIAAADLDGDGRTDLAVANSDANDVSLLVNHGDGTFAAPLNYGTDAVPVSIAVADLNGDGRPDLAVANRGTSDVSVLLNRGNGALAAPVNYPAGPSPLVITAADLNGDGRPDLAVGYDGGGNSIVSVLVNQGDGTFARALDYGMNRASTSMVAADLDGDGVRDLAVLNPAAHVTVFLNACLP
jgi:hypothetical protein